MISMQARVLRQTMADINLTEIWNAWFATSEMIFKNREQRDWCGVLAWGFFSQNTLHDIGAIFTAKKTLRGTFTIKTRMFLLFWGAFLCVVGGFFSLTIIDSFGSLLDSCSNQQILNRFGGLGWYCTLVNMSIYASSAINASLCVSLNYTWLLSLYFHNTVIFLFFHIFKTTHFQFILFCALCPTSHLQ